MKFYKKIENYPLILLFLFILVGFADCHFEARQFVYKLDSCPDKNWQLPEYLKNDELEIRKKDIKEYEKNFSCNNLNLYEFNKKIVDKNKKEDWVTFHSYVGIQKNLDSCNLIVSTEYIGPFLSEEKSIAELPYWEKISTKFAQSLLSSSAIYLDEKPLKTSVIRDKNEYKNWCTSFPSR